MSDCVPSLFQGNEKTVATVKEMLRIKHVLVEVGLKQRSPREMRSGGVLNKLH